MHLPWMYALLLTTALTTGAMAVPIYSDYPEKQLEVVNPSQAKNTFFPVVQSVLQQIHPRATDVKWYRVDIPKTSYFVYKARFIQEPEKIDLTVKLESYSDGLEWNYTIDSLYRLHHPKESPVEIMSLDTRKKMDAFLKKHTRDDIFRLEHRHALSPQHTVGAKLYGIKLFSGYGVYNGTNTAWFDLKGQAVSKAPFKH